MSRIVLIGGMGPQASLELHRRILSDAASRGARDNDEYPEIIHVSIPVPDFISSGDSAEGLRRIKQSLDGVHLRKDDQLVLACNTAHLVLTEIENQYKVKFISLINVVVDAVKHNKNTRVGLLASPATIKMQLYQKPIRGIGVDVLLPTDKEINQLEIAIRHIIANGSPKEAVGAIEPVVLRMSHEGADRVILGCTELSVIFDNFQDDRVLDPLSEVCNQLKNN